MLNSSWQQPHWQGKLESDARPNHFCSKKFQERKNHAHVRQQLILKWNYSNGRLSRAAINMMRSLLTPKDWKQKLYEKTPLSNHVLNSRYLWFISALNGCHFESFLMILLNKENGFCKTDFLTFKIGIFYIKVDYLMVTCVLFYMHFLLFYF